MKWWWVWIGAMVPLMAAEKIEVAKAAELLEQEEKKVQVLDVRTTEEWEDGVIEGAVRINWRGEGFEEKVGERLDPERPVLVYCRSGGRSAEAAESLEKLGFKQVSDLDGGVLAWGEAGKKLVK